MEKIIILSHDLPKKVSILDIKESFPIDFEEIPKTGKQSKIVPVNVIEEPVKENIRPFYEQFANFK